MMGQKGRRSVVMVYNDMMMVLMLLLMLSYMMMLELYGHVVWLHTMATNHDVMRREIVMMVHCRMIQLHDMM
jgi:hypothetical protein